MTTLICEPLMKLSTSYAAGNVVPGLGVVLRSLERVNVIFLFGTISYIGQFMFWYESQILS